MSILDWLLIKPQPQPSHTRTFLEPYDFNQALEITVAERFQICIDRVEKYFENADDPLVMPDGATTEELTDLEHELGIALPPEYAQFLRRWRYFDIDDGQAIYGLGVNKPWLSTDHRHPYRYLVFGDYWSQSDGDQLMFDLNEPDFPVVVYLHDHGPLIEYFAPSFSLALWRIVHERYCER